MKHKTIIVKNSSQKNYRYKLTEPAGKNFHPDFKPELTPKQMLDLGVFEGNYFDGEFDDLPIEWFDNAKVSMYKDPKLNFFGIAASQPLEVWQQKGWINEKHDPKGWFQWYCRYYMGRRLPEEDLRQIKRWKAINRHIGQIKKNCRKGDLSCRKKQRQALLHWAIDSRKI